MRFPVPASLHVRDRVDRLDLPFDRWGYDPYGVEKESLARFLTALDLLYHTYFRVDVHGIGHVPGTGRAMLVANHAGGVAFDAVVLLGACFFELEPPRLAQGMAEKFINAVPLASAMSARVGQFPGLPEHAERLLGEGRLLSVFPEGARGTAKLFKERRSLVRFGTGFVRLAMKTQSPIVPIGILGAGEAFPTVANLKRLGKLMGVPYVPVPRWGLPLPRPAEFTLLFGEPIWLAGTGREDDATVAGNVERVKGRIRTLIEQGHALREGRIGREQLLLGE
ncbi:MAG: lysophospholipid acyltransferase family protein [Myxococcota bacterium]